LEFGVLCFTPGREEDSGEQGFSLGCLKKMKELVAVWRRKETTGKVRGRRKEGGADMAVSCRKQVCGLEGRWGGCGP
jgi:hypothetical protein